MKRRDFSKAGALGAAGMLTGHAAAADPPMKVVLWCWDARMTWDDEPDKISLKMAASEKAFPYLKRGESYLVGFKRLVDHCAKIGVHGVIVWGFLRDCHGGVAAARELCTYASDRGIAILPGVGLCAYGGYYFEGNHPFNLATYLREHPERASEAREEGGGRVVRPVLDPSLEANQRWWREGLEWMVETFAIGGIDFEMGDFVVNLSEQARQARAALGFEADGNILDVVVATQGLLDRALGLKPEGIFINSTYRGYHQIKNFPSMPYVHAVHARTAWQYTLRGMVGQKAFPDGFAGAPQHRRYGMLHWFNPSTGTTDRDYVADIAQTFPGLHKLDFEFVGTYGEVSARSSVQADRNYRAQVAWAKEPQLTIADFLEQVRNTP